MEEQAPMDIYESKHQDLTPKSDMWDCLEKNYKTIGPSSIQFCDDSSKPVFIIDKNGCHVPEGVSADEAAQVVIGYLDDHIKRIVESLKKENTELKAKIAEDKEE